MFYQNLYKFFIGPNSLLRSLEWVAYCSNSVSINVQLNLYSIRPFYKLYLELLTVSITLYSVYWQ